MIDDSVLGGILIISGLYVVLWGKSKEMKKINNVSSDQEQPAPAALLPSSTRPQESQLIEVVATTRVLDTNNTKWCVQTITTTQMLGLVDAISIANDAAMDTPQDNISCIS